MSGIGRDPSYMPAQATNAINECLEWASTNYRLVWTVLVSALVLAIYWKSIVRALLPSKGPASLSKDKSKFEQMREARKYRATVLTPLFRSPDG